MAEDFQPNHSVVLRASGATEYLTPKGERWTLEEMQKIVGGYIELVRVFSRHGAVLFVNEEGIPLGLPINAVATDVAGKPIYGDALLVHPSHMTD